MYVCVCDNFMLWWYVQIPSALFPVPTAKIWIDMARVVNGDGIDHKIIPVCVIGAGIEYYYF